MISTQDIHSNLLYRMVFSKCCLLGQQQWVMNIGGDYNTIQPKNQSFCFDCNGCNVKCTTPNCIINITLQMFMLIHRLEYHRTRGRVIQILVQMIIQINGGHLLIQQIKQLQMYLLIILKSNHIHFGIMHNSKLAVGSVSPSEIFESDAGEPLESNKQNDFKLNNQHLNNNVNNCGTTQYRGYNIGYNV